MNAPTPAMIAPKKNRAVDPTLSDDDLKKIVQSSPSEEERKIAAERLYARYNIDKSLN